MDVSRLSVNQLRAIIYECVYDAMNGGVFKPISIQEQKQMTRFTPDTLIADAIDKKDIALRIENILL